MDGDSSGSSGDSQPLLPPGTRMTSSGWIVTSRRSSLLVHAIGQEQWFVIVRGLSDGVILRLLSKITSGSDKIRVRRSRRSILPATVLGANSFGIAGHHMNDTRKLATTRTHPSDPRRNLYAVQARLPPHPSGLHPSWVLN